MKTNLAKPTASSSNPGNPKRATKHDGGAQSKQNAAKTVHKQPPPLAPTQRQLDAQETVRLSLVSVDQANKTNPQCVAVYCEKIFQRFLAEEVA